MIRKNPLHHLPRSERAIVNLFATALLLFLLYLSNGSPAFTPEKQFRREERSNFVGPAKILDTVPLEGYTGYSQYDKLLLATSAEGVTLFCYNEENLARNKFVYREMMGDVTVLSFPVAGMSSFESAAYVNIPIVLFDNFPDATRVEMEIELVEKYSDDTEFRKVYTLASDRVGEGYFLFALSVSSSDQLGREGHAIWQLTNISDDSPFNASVEVAFPIIVRFYDQKNNMICERSLVLRSPAGEAHASGMG